MGTEPFSKATRMTSASRSCFTREHCPPGTSHSRPVPAQLATVSLRLAVYGAMHELTQSTRSERLYALLGDLPDRNRPIHAELIAREEREHYVLEVLQLDLNGMEPVPAYFTRPRRDERSPVVLYNHAHGREYALGKDEFLSGRSALQSPPYAVALAQMGIAGLCIDAWNFGERRGRTESELFKELLWRGHVLWGLMMYDTLRATDYVLSR